MGSSGTRSISAAGSVVKASVPSVVVAVATKPNRSKSTETETRQKQTAQWKQAPR